MTTESTSSGNNDLQPLREAPAGARAQRSAKSTMWGGLLPKGGGSLCEMCHLASPAMDEEDVVAASFGLCLNCNSLDHGRCARARAVAASSEARPLPSPAPLTVTVSPSATASKLATWFLESYTQGRPLDLEGYEYKQGGVWTHEATGIRVWPDWIDVSQGSGDRVVLLHYTDKVAFGNITHAAKESTEIWASLQPFCAHYGQGVYGSAKDPEQFGSPEAVLENNYRPQRALFLQGQAGLPDPARASQLVKENRRFMDTGTCSWCIALVVDVEQAYNVHQRATPEMLDGPGRNIHGKPLDR